jgi:hypothetical protein
VGRGGKKLLCEKEMCIVSSKLFNICRTEEGDQLIGERLSRMRKTYVKRRSQTFAFHRTDREGQHTAIRAESKEPQHH